MNDKKKIKVWIQTKQVTKENKSTSFTFTLQYDKLNAKSFKVDRPFANGSWYQESLIKLVSMGKEGEESTDEEDEEE